MNSISTRRHVIQCNTVWMRAIWMILASTTFWGCGYHSGLRLPEHTRSVGIEFFGNDTQLRQLELDLAGELSRAVADMIAVPLVPANEADLVIRGRIADFRRTAGARDENGQLLGASLRVTVEASLIDRRSQENLGIANAALWSGYVARDASNSFAIARESELDARRRALRNIAQELVLDLFSPLESTTFEEDNEPFNAPAGASISATQDGE